MNKNVSDDGPVLILSIPYNSEFSEFFDKGGLKLSTLLIIHKTLTRFAIDWEIGSTDGEKALVDQDINTEEAKEFYRTYLGKIASPTNLENLKGGEFRGLIVPSMPGLIGNFRGQGNMSRVSYMVKQVLMDCKGAIFSGYGLVASFDCKDVNHNWIFCGNNVTSVSLVQQSCEEKFSNLPFLIEDKVREMGGLFCWSDKATDLMVVERNIITVQDDRSMKIACNTFGYLLSDRA